MAEIEFKSSEIYKSQARQEVMPAKKPESFWQKYKLAIIWGGVGVLLVVVIAVVAICLINSQTEITEEANNEEAGGTQQVSTKEIYDLDATDSDERSEAVAVFEAEIAAAADDEARAELYGERAAYLYAQLGLADADAQTEMGAQILADALAAEELLQTAESAYDVYFYASALGDSTVAEEHLQIVEERDPDYYSAEGAG